MPYCKIKCNGQQKCERCNNRGLDCRYSSPANRSVGMPLAHTEEPSSTSWTDTIQKEPELLSVEMVNNFVDPSHILDATQKQAPCTVMDWQNGTLNQATENFDWNSLEPSFNTLDSPGDSMTADFEFIQSPMQITPQSLSQTTPSSYNTSIALPMSSIPGTSLHYQPPSINCQCRATLMSHIPKVKQVMRERPKPRLDRVFKVTEDVIKGCQEIIDCISCQVGFMDLVCTMAVFQQTSPCFDYIAKVDLNSAVKVSIGEYQVSLVDDTRLRHMLVTDLVGQANALLRSSSAIGQSLFLSQSLSCDLNQTNLDYLQEVAKKFEDILRSITEPLGGENA